MKTCKSHFGISHGVKKRVFDDTPETEAIFRELALANHPETDIEHFRAFMQNARDGVEALERERDEARSALRISNMAIMRLNSELGQGGDDFPQNSVIEPH